MPANHFRVILGTSGLGLLLSCTPAVPQQILLNAPPANARPRIALMESALDWTETPFVRGQLQYGRVRATRSSAQSRLERVYAEKRIPYPAAELYVRVFKRTRELEVWVRPDGERQYRLLKTYPICALAGVPGPKRKRGDAQVPEGFYFIEHFNPVSQYHLSLKVDYPNARDRAANTRGDLGGDIFIHGGCKSDGCLAMTDSGIEELYWLAVQARGRGQQRIPVHIFPVRLDDVEMRRIDFDYVNQPTLIAFWKTLKPGYDYFERTRRVPLMAADPRGRYLLDN